MYLSLTYVCWVSHTAWKGLLRGHFSIAISPDGVSIGKAPTQRDSKITIQTSNPSHFICSRNPVCLGHFRKYLVSGGIYTECEFGYQALVANSYFHSVVPKKVQPSNSLKLHPIAAFLLLTTRALFHPLGFLKQAGDSQRPSPGSIPVECNLFCVTTVRQSALSDTLPQPVSTRAFPARHRNVFSNHRKCRETHCPHSRC